VHDAPRKERRNDGELPVAETMMTNSASTHGHLSISPRLFSKRGAALVSIAALLLMSACIEEEKRDPSPASDAGADGSSSGGASSGGSSSSGASSGGSSGATQKVPDTFKDACKADGECKTNHMCIKGVCVPKLDSSDTTTVTDPQNDNEPTSEKVSLGCKDETVADMVKGLPSVATVTMWGRVDRFGGGGATIDIEVSVFKASDFNPKPCATIVDPAESRACYGDESKVGKPLAKVTSVGYDGGVKKGWHVRRPLKDQQECTKGKHLTCPHGSLCDKVDGFPKCTFQHGLYAISGLPTNVALIVRTRAAKENDPNGWRDSYIWNVVLFSNRLDPKGEDHQPKAFIGTDTYRYNPTIVGEGQWKLVPDTIGVLGGISDGDGVIGGRVRDCGTDKRRSWSLFNTKIGIGIPAEGLAYFNKSEVDTVPVKSRTATNHVGRYAAVGIPAGPNRIAVAGRVDGKDVAIGYSDVYVIPNSLVIVSLPGFVPHLNK